MRALNRVAPKDKKPLSFNELQLLEEGEQEEHALERDDNRSVMNKIKVNLNGVTPTSKRPASSRALRGRQRRSHRGVHQGEKTRKKYVVKRGENHAPITKRSASPRAVRERQRRAQHSVNSRRRLRTNKAKLFKRSRASHPNYIVSHSRIPIGKKYKLNQLDKSKELTPGENVAQLQHQAEHERDHSQVCIKTSKKTLINTNQGVESDENRSVMNKIKVNLNGVTPTSKRPESSRALRALRGRQRRAQHDVNGRRRLRANKVKLSPLRGATAPVASSFHSLDAGRKYFLRTHINGVPRAGFYYNNLGRYQQTKMWDQTNVAKAKGISDTHPTDGKDGLERGCEVKLSSRALFGHFCAIE